MIPGVDPRQMKAMMKQMGMSQDEIAATRVSIETADKVFIFDSPSVIRIKMKGDETFQLSGSYRVEDVSVKVEISDDDVAMVAEQGNVSVNEARVALEKAKGDIAQAIVDISGE